MGRAIEREKNLSPYLARMKLTAFPKILFRNSKAFGIDS
jgi:hypothetical protein